ncbi:MAG: hypothetical protein ABJF50_17360 [Paracoccaceae bacterium]
MTRFMTLPLVEQALTVLLFVLYLVTAVRLCRYSSWRARGAPNPFLPRRAKMMLRAYAKRQMSRGRLPAFA